MKHAITTAIAAALACLTAHADDDHLNAKAICQKFVAKQLKAPATAKFEPVSSVAAQPAKDGPANTWESVGYVDSQNAFGAMLRSTYFCTVRKTGPDKWRLIELSWLKDNV
ncbi:hypothetical protein [Hydrogenophaga sp. MI9]|uniref:hypothetical protein n=1 Tax=Hydrogenophaga sp. MI9 TaxID=3453719 RepID=UPI003EE83D13